MHINFNVICRGDDCGTMYVPSTNQYVAYYLDDCNWIGGAYDYISSYYEISKNEAYIVPQKNNRIGRFLGKGSNLGEILKENL